MQMSLFFQQIQVGQQISLILDLLSSLNLLEMKFFELSFLGCRFGSGPIVGMVETLCVSASKLTSTRTPYSS